jgi:hypothetical protein
MAAVFELFLTADYFRIRRAREDISEVRVGPPIRI